MVMPCSRSAESPSGAARSTSSDLFSLRSSRPPHIDPRRSILFHTAAARSRVDFPSSTLPVVVKRRRVFSAGVIKSIPFFLLFMDASPVRSITRFFTFRFLRPHFQIMSSIVLRSIHGARAGNTSEAPEAAHHRFSVVFPLSRRMPSSTMEHDETELKCRPAGSPPGTSQNKSARRDIFQLDVMPDVLLRPVAQRETRMECRH